MVGFCVDFLLYWLVVLVVLFGLGVFFDCLGFAVLLVWYFWFGWLGGVWVWFCFSPSNLLWEGTGGKESSSDEWDVSVSASLLKPLPFR